MRTNRELKMPVEITAEKQRNEVERAHE